MTPNLNDGLQSGPLSGLRVVELGRFVAAPYAARLLGDLGADVIKVETAEGDPFRKFVQARPGGLSSSFTALNRNKRCLAVDLKSFTGREAIARSIRAADVFIENTRPGTLGRLGLADEDVRDDNPGLIYCSISGFGDSGPYADRPGYDMIGQAVSGLASQLLDPEAPQVMGPNLSDSITGMTAAYAVLAALHERSVTGVGQRLAINLVSSTLAFLGTEAQRFLDTGEIPNHLTRPSGSLAFVFRCADGRLLSVHLSSPPKFWLGLLSVLQRPDLDADVRFSTHHQRQAYYLELRDELAPLFRSRKLGAWIHSLVEAGVPCAAVNDMRDVFADEQVRSLGSKRSFNTDVADAGATVDVPVKFSRHGPQPMRLPPQLGEHSEDVLLNLGYSAEEIVQAVTDGWAIARS